MYLVINRCYGGFGLSHEAIIRYCELKGYNLIIQPKDSSLVPYEYYVNGLSDDHYFIDSHIERDDPALVQVVEEMQSRSWGPHAKLSIVEIPDNVKWTVEEYDGQEWVAEVHRTWI